MHAMKWRDASFPTFSNSLVVVLSNVRLLLILLALGLAVGAVPVHQHHQGQDEHQVGDQDGVRDRGKCLRPKMSNVKANVKLFKLFQTCHNLR